MGMPAIEMTQNSSICKHCSLGVFCRNVTSEWSLVTEQLVLHRKESLYSYHDSFSSLYAIASGGIKTCYVDMEGQERIHQFYLSGEVLGFEAIHSKYYPFTAKAMTHTKVCRIPYERLMRFMATHPHLLGKLLESISQRFNFGKYTNSPTAEQRLATFLFELQERIPDHQAKIDFNLCMSRQDIGSYLDLATETISRLLSRFKKEQILEVKNKSIKIIDPAKLRQIAQDGLIDS